MNTDASQAEINEEQMKRVTRLTELGDQYEQAGNLTEAACMYNMAEEAKSYISRGQELPKSIIDTLNIIEEIDQFVDVGDRVSLEAELDGIMGRKYCGQ